LQFSTKFGKNHYFAPQPDGKGEAIMKASHVVTVLSLFGLSTFLSPVAAGGEPEDIHILQSAQNATTRSDHEAIAKYYDDAAKVMQLKMQEKKQLLKHYQEKSYLYGREAQDLQSHTEALAHQYEKAVENNVKEAHLHQQMALDIEETIPFPSTPQKLSAVPSHHNLFTAE
jgi:hypothetical protein